MMNAAVSGSDDLIPEITLNQEMIKLLDHLPDPYCIKNRESRIIYANEPMAREVFNVKSTKELIGKLDCEIDSALEEFDNPREFVKQDRRVMSTEKANNILENHPYAIDYPIVVNKLPFKDMDDKCVGVLVYTKKLEVYTLNDYVKGHMPGSLLLNKPDDFFTEKECEVMFFRLQGMKSKQVAKRLNLAENTVHNYMQKLYNKSGTTHIDDFRAFCEQRHYHRYLPKRFLQTDHIEFDTPSLR
ncbi:helix-turn-helix transcriptional regulator [Acerihabitans arboris]|nr:helix-turn-helix transcriptional regulator [Acerihabitans arboris]